MHFTLEQRFDAPLAAVEAAFADPELFGHLAAMAELGRPELLERVADGDAIRLQVRYRFTGDLAPGVASVVDREHLTWVEESELDCRTHRQTFRIVPEHYADRLKCSGVVTLDETDGTTLRVAEADLDVRLPFVGHKLAKAIIAGLVANAATQQVVVAEWLARRYEDGTPEA